MAIDSPSCILSIHGITTHPIAVIQLTSDPVSTLSFTIPEWYNSWPQVVASFWWLYQSLPMLVGTYASTL
jgi:hypothetical protein